MVPLKTMKKILFFLPGRILSILPRGLQLWLGNRLGDMAFLVMRHRRNITIRNMQIAFPDANSVNLARSCFRHFGCSILEVFCLPYFGSTMQKWLRFKGMEIFQALRDEGQGVILLTSHFGNWEVMSWCTQFDIKVSGLYQKLSFSLADQLFMDLRQVAGMQLIQKKSGIRELIYDVLDRKEIMGLVGDQGRGQTIEFFGKETNFPLGPAETALKKNVPLIFTVCIRRGNYLDMEVLEEIPLENGEDESQIIYNTTRTYIKSLERLVNKYPEQYFWLHDIWKQFKRT